MDFIIRACILYSGGSGIDACRVLGRLLLRLPLRFVWGPLLLILSCIASVSAHALSP